MYIHLPSYVSQVCQKGHSRCNPELLPFCERLPTMTRKKPLYKYLLLCIRIRYHMQPSAVRLSHKQCKHQHLYSRTFYMQSIVEHKIDEKECTSL